ncbi:metal-sensitive transcriptional regulator [Gordonia alkaliphila]|uniref:Metal-sensitive transcriptional regulator n=1 Tax=Gordonia alkaliphila TaxID=1053547 RepID=A0ABP8ZBN8_9ACTN|nr:metal-sensitive transcriptional regulator [Gordonia alkaliphila]MCK0438913.1 metal-sensitive transcriptional regulator [Gordonia alkaliphila]
MSDGHGYIADKAAYVRRLKLIEGQARGLQRMVDDEVYCIDILTQVTAMKRALESVSLELLRDHMGHCVVDAARESDDAAAAKIDEAMKAITRLVKS